MQTNRLVSIIFAAAAAGTSADALAIDVEVTFDDADDGAGTADGNAALNNLETKALELGAGEASVAFVGTAQRSGIDQGRYGRAGDFPGGAGGIEVSPWPLRPSRAFHMWLRPRDVNGGTIVALAGSWDVHFEAEELVVGVVREGVYETHATGVAWPGDGAWHHLSIYRVAAADSTGFGVSVDFAGETLIETGFALTPADAPLTVAVDYDGMIDELLFTQTVPMSPNERFDRDPAYCPAGTTCSEEAITTVPRDMVRAVPVRLKYVRAAGECTEAAPCPVLFDVSGGNACADDYDSPVAVADLAAAGFLVVAADVYCESGQAYSTFPMETSQLVAAKDHVFAASAVAGLVDDAQYMASGCSHGAGAVNAWAVLEADFPARTFVRSTAGAGLCSVAAGVLCPDVIESYEAQFGAFDDLDWDDPEIRAFHERGDLVGALSENIAASREIARAWGLNTVGPVCGDDGSVACNEDGMWGMTYASRRFRDRWQQLQPVGAPTGYFVEDVDTDCNHCADPGTPAWECGVCLLRVGRAGMAAECPACLDYSSAGIQAGAPAQKCPLEADWYVDPLFPPDAGTADAGVAGPDAAAAADGDGGGGCGCRAGGGVPGALWGLVLLSLLAGRRRAWPVQVIATAPAGDGPDAGVGTSPDAAPPSGDAPGAVRLSFVRARRRKGLRR